MVQKIGGFSFFKEFRIVIFVFDYQFYRFLSYFLGDFIDSSLVQLIGVWIFHILINLFDE